MVMQSLLTSPATAWVKRQAAAGRYQCFPDHCTSSEHKAMNHSEGYFINHHKHRIFYQAWLPEPPVKAVLLVIHGLGEHCGRYAGLADYFVPLGYAVYGFDHIGHGRSDGERQYVESFQALIDTLGGFFEIVLNREGDAPLFLLSHSMGGLVAAQYLLGQGAGVAGAIFSAPLIKVSAVVHPGIIGLVNGLSVIAPKFRLWQIDCNGISRDPAVIEAYKKDRLVYHGKCTARMSAALLKAMLRVQAQAHSITLPFIVLQGSADRIVDPGGAAWLYEKAGSKHKTLKIYPGLYHEVFNEPERGVVLKNVRDWLGRYA